MPWSPGTRPAWSFEPIADPRVHERVVAQITFAIRSGAYGVGVRLPSVGELARQMRVSKPTVGEAIRVLASFGVVKTRRGVNGGVTVTNDDIPITLLQLTGSEATMRELLEARRPVEMEIARLAAQRADAGDFDVLRESIASLEAHARDDDRVRIHYDHLFHYAMGRAARSELLAYYQHQILQGITVVLQPWFAQQENNAVVIDLHRRTLEAIREGDLEPLDEVMDEHLSYLEQAVLGEQPPDAKVSARR